MAVRLVNTLTTAITFPDIPHYKVPAGAGSHADFPAVAIQNSAYAQAAISDGKVTVDGSVITPAEAALIGLPMTETVTLLAAGPAAGYPDYKLRYPTGAGSGDPAIKTTYTYGDAGFPTVATAIVETVDVVP